MSTKGRHVASDPHPMLDISIDSVLGRDYVFIDDGGPLYGWPHDDLQHIPAEWPAPIRAVFADIAADPAAEIRYRVG